MCSKRVGRPDYARMREEMARRLERRVSGDTPAHNTHPRENQGADRAEVRRGVEKLSALVGN